jgi:hypothetical protein
VVSEEQLIECPTRQQADGRGDQAWHDKAAARVARAIGVDQCPALGLPTQEEVPAQGEHEQDGTGSKHHERPCVHAVNHEHHCGADRGQQDEGQPLRRRAGAALEDSGVGNLYRDGEDRREEDAEQQGPVGTEDGSRQYKLAGGLRVMVIIDVQPQISWAASSWSAGTTTRTPPNATVIKLWVCEMLASGTWASSPPAFREPWIRCASVTVDRLATVT